MEIISIKDNYNYLYEYIKLCKLEWGTKIESDRLDSYIKERMNNLDNIISVLGLIDDNVLIGFISLLRIDGDERNDLSPWYATMYVKKEYRGKGYSKILNDSILKEAKNKGYNKVYLKTSLINYY